MAQTITIRGRVFEVTETEVRGTKQYVLKGVRGALYTTARNANEATRLFLIDQRGFGIPSTMQGVWLSDKDGALKVVQG